MVVESHHLISHKPPTLFQFPILPNSTRRLANNPSRVSKFKPKFPTPLLSLFLWQRFLSPANLRRFPLSRSFLQFANINWGLQYVHNPFKWRKRGIVGAMDRASREAWLGSRWKRWLGHGGDSGECCGRTVVADAWFFDGGRPRQRQVMAIGR